MEFFRYDQFAPLVMISLTVPKKTWRDNVKLPDIGLRFCLR